MVRAVDDLYQILGQPGNYAKFIFFLLALNYFPITFNHLAMVPYGPRKVAFTCSHPDNVASNITISPPGDACSVYVNYSDVNNNETMPCTSGYKYATPPSYFDGQPDESNIVMEWDLVCDQRYLVNLATTIYFAGVMVGGLVMGTVSDKIGRQPTMLLCLFLPVILGVMVYFVQSYILFVMLRFLIGVLMQGLQTCSFVLFTESFRLGTHRAYVCALMECAWACGYMSIAGISFFVRDWRWIQLAITLPSVLALPYICLIPESLRWLLTGRQYVRAKAYIVKAADFNNVQLPDGVLGLKESGPEESNVSVDNIKSYNVFDMFKTPKIRLRALVMFYVWFATSLTYYGLSLNASGFAGDKYLNFFVSGAVELPAYLSGIYILSRFGRRIPLCIYFLLGGTVVIIAGAIPKTTASGEDIAWVKNMFAWIGKFSFAGCWSVIFLYSNELFPTVIRNVAVGACAFWARVGSLVAPQMLLMGDYTFQELPLIIMGAIGILGGFITLALPETLHKKMPDTIEAAEGLATKEQDLTYDNQAFSNINDTPERSTKM